MKTWMTAVAIVAIGVGATAAVVGLTAAQPGHGTGATGADGHSDYRAVDRGLKEFDRVTGEGRGFGLAFAADQHGYPGPMHVLELKDRLRLVGDQEQAMRRLVEATFAQSRPAAARLLITEHRLRALFATGLATEAAVRGAVTEVERARAELRLIHLLAHLETRDLLSIEQRQLYHAARW